MAVGRILPGRSEMLTAMTIALAVTLIGVTAAIAGNMSFQSGGAGWSSPLIFQGVIVGLGNDAAFVDVTVNGSVRAICTNKGGASAPGRNYITVAVSGSGGPFEADENGRAEVLVEVAEPTSADFVRSPSPKVAGCPSGKWTVTGIVPDTVDWDEVTAFARAVQGGPVLDTLFLTCVTTFHPDGTTSGVCTQP